MRVAYVVFTLLLGSAFAQEDFDDTLVRSPHLRRPRPPIQIDNFDGIAQGRPVPLKDVPGAQKSTADLLAAALGETESRGQNLRDNDPLRSLLLTATSEGQGFEDVRPEIEDEEEDLRPATRARVPSVPRRQARPRSEAQQQRQRPETGSADEAESPRQRPRGETIDTIERYSHTNADGSFTFGYVSEDGSFREETRGVDCITRGKYGYIDPEGKKREFAYVSGLPCDTVEQGEEGGTANLDGNSVREDPIDPAERFRQAQAVQLSDDEIPQSARPQRVRTRPFTRPDLASSTSALTDQAEEVNFQREGDNPRRARPRPTSAPRARPTGGDASALQNLFSIAEGGNPTSPSPPVTPTTPFTATTPRPSSIPTTPAPRPRPTTPNSRPQPASFGQIDDSDSFTLSRPSLTFEDGSNRPVSPSAGAPGPSFSTDLVFDPASGTFKTEVRQSVVEEDGRPGQRVLATTASPFSPTPAPQQPTARPFTVFGSTTTRRPDTREENRGAFQSLSFPDPSSIAATASSTTTAAAPTTPRASPVPSQSPTPTPTPTLIPTSPAGFPSATTARPANTFFFQPFSTVGSPSPAPTSPRPPVPFTSSFSQPTPFAPTAQGEELSRPPAAAAPAPSAPAPTPLIQFGFQPVPASPQPQLQPQPQASPFAPAQPFRTFQGQPQPQQGSRPFTAFSNGTPPQLSGPPPSFQSQQPQASSFQPRPQGAAPFSAFRSGPPPPPPPPQSQSQQPRFLPQPGQGQFVPGVPPQLQPSRFDPFGRPQGQPFAPQQSSPFTVFNPATLRGA